MGSLRAYLSGVTTQRWVLEERSWVDSTQDVVLAGSDGPHGWVVFTEDQRHGRGRLDRVWSTPPGSGIAMSILLHPTRESRAWGWLPLALGIAVRNTLVARGLSASVKWPNDVLIDHPEGGRKIAGILTTVKDHSVVLGVGINTRMTPDQRPIATATSLAMEGQADVDGRRLAEQVLAEFASILDVWESGQSLRETYMQVCSTMHHRVKITRVDGSVCVGHAIDVTADGALIVDVDGTRETLTAGDVEHVREEL